VDAGDAAAEDEDSLWVRSFLRTQPGKTYRIDSTDEEHEEAARAALALAARILTDEALFGSEGPGTNATQAPSQPS
jgi:hypothetical protein